MDEVDWAGLLGGLFVPIQRPTFQSPLAAGSSDRHWHHLVIADAIGLS